MDFQTKTFSKILRQCALLDDRLVFLDEDLSYQARGMYETLPQGIAQHS